MVRAVRPFRSLSMARGCARIDSRLDTVKISLAGRVEVHHARFLAVIGVRKTFPHGLDPSRTLRVCSTWGGATSLWPLDCEVQRGRLQRSAFVTPHEVDKAHSGLPLC